MSCRRIDLHTHSLASDGSDSPVELVNKAASLGLAAIALTDHDTLSGLDEAVEQGEKTGVRVIRGIEIAVHDDFGELHLLGLWMPRPSKVMRSYLTTLRRNRLARNQAMLDALTAMDMPLAMEQVEAVSRGESLGRPHIALAMRDRGYVSSRKEAFERYIGWGGKAFVPRALSSPREGIELLRGEGATVSLAHPFLSRQMTESRLDALLRDFRAWGLDAVEAYHSTHSQQQVSLCVKLAAKHGLLLTGGSDYHGLNKEVIRLGVGTGSLRVPFVLLEKLLAFRLDRGLWI